jgi:hypothetical protein
VDSSKRRLDRLCREFRPWLGNVDDGGAANPAIFREEHCREAKQKRKVAKTQRELLCASAPPRPCVEIHARL